MKNDLKNFYKKAPVEEVNTVQDEPKAGQCTFCRHGSFSLRLQGEYIIRKCKQCGTEQEPIK